MFKMKQSVFDQMVSSTYENGTMTDTLYNWFMSMATRFNLSTVKLGG